MIEYLAWTPTREVFIETMCALINPITQTPLAYWDDEIGNLMPSECVLIDEIGEIVSYEWDEEEEEFVVTKRVEGHHVNLAAVGALEDLLRSSGGWEGIFPLLGEMEEAPEEDGVPPSWVGTSGMKIFPADKVNKRHRIWA